MNFADEPLDNPIVDDEDHKNAMVHGHLMHALRMSCARERADQVFNDCDVYQYVVECIYREMNQNYTDEMIRQYYEKTHRIPDR